MISKENTALVIPNAISVTTFRKEYVFRSFWDRDECYNLVRDLVEQVKGSRGLGAGAGGQDKQEEAAASGGNGSTIAPHSPGPAPLATLSNPNPDPTSPSSSTVTSDGGGSSGTTTTSSGNGNGNGQEEYETDTKRGSVRTGAVVDNPEEAYAAEVEKNRLKHETGPVVVSGSIQDIFDKFIADDAPLSYQKYQGDTGDKDVVTTPWSSDASSLDMGFTRDMRFLKPVAIPAMPFARALMIQRFQRFGDVGLTIASSTRMEDVPYCDFFTVEVLLTAKATADGEVTLLCYYDVKFIQSTMFRRFIEGNTNPDVKKWNEEFMAFIKEVSERIAVIGVCVSEVFLW